MSYPGEWIPTVCVVRPNGERIYYPIKEYAKQPKSGHFVDNSVPSFFRPMVNGKWPEPVCRKYRTIEIGKEVKKGTKAYFDSYGRIVFKAKSTGRYKLEEISE
jgi:hypothetical protein